MKRSAAPYERWIWLELIGFDNEQDDFGVDAYIETTGFTPHVVCLLLSSVDFVLQHEHTDQKVALPPDVCSREGHEHNQDRQRQSWTNRQLRGLIHALRQRGVGVYATVFSQHHDNRHHQEWATDHPEVRAYHTEVRHRGGINPLSRLRDGTAYEDIFIPRLVQVMADYGFDGWHGADGYGPLSGPIYDTDFSDAMAVQFAESGPCELPDWITRPADDDPDGLCRRAEWIWRNRRREWIRFYARRWTQFWQKAVDALHGIGRQAAINSAWGRAPWESLYRYGIDYRAIARTGVDAMIVETVAAALTLDPRCGDPSRHYDFLAMLMLIKACVPDMKLIFLHTTHDIVETWDVLRHGPAILEKEIFSLANVHHTGRDGRPRRCADGLLVCLGDGIKPHEWQWLRQRWEIAFQSRPKRVHGAAILWSSAAMDSQVDDYIDHRTWTVHRTLYHLMLYGAPVQTTVDVGSIGAATGPLLVINPHLLPETERRAVLAYGGGPVIVIGPEADSLPEPALRFCDVYGPRKLVCSVYAHAPSVDARLEPDGPEEPLGPSMEIVEPRAYWDHLPFRKVSPSFLQACADVIRACAGVGRVTDGVTTMTTEAEDGTLRIAVKNQLGVYTTATVDVGQPIERTSVVTPFPMMPVVAQESTVAVKAPPQGIVVVDVTCGAEA